MFARFARLAGAVGAAAVVAGVMATGSAHASIVGDATTHEQAGYSVTGGQFRFVSSTFTLPAASKEPNPQTGLSVQLKNSLETAVLGISDGGTGNWNAGFAQEFPNLSVGHSDGASPAWVTGDNVTLSLYYNPASHFLFYSARNNTTGSTFGGSYKDEASPGVRQSFKDARIGAEFATDAYASPTSFTRPPASVKLAAFKDSRITTYSGHHGSLLDWWSTAPLVMTADGTPSGHVDASPGSIWGSGSAAGENFSVFVRP